ncbi:MAG: UDP-N-acetylmuramate dehydrogenase [Planctomycetaceae bacterium]|nr:UDP-N-acetylmuramate dehydrogenase [Planctomycetaceae bacterium]
MSSKLLTKFPGIIQTQEPLAMHTWFQLGGNAEYFAEPQSWETFLDLLKYASLENIPVHILGSGSNVLVRNEGVSGLVISVGEALPSLLEVNENCVRVSGNVPLSRLVIAAVRAGLGGIEDLIGIPGTVGGALHGNIGTDSTDIGQFLKCAKIASLDGTVSVVDKADMIFGYHQSSLADSIVLEAEFEFREENPLELTQRMQKRWIIRKASQPMGHQGSGRIFRNSTESGMSASELVEHVGMLGTRVGGASVCERHANYIVTEPDCTPNDVLRLIRLIQEQVHEHAGIRLELELEIW